MKRKLFLSLAAVLMAVFAIKAQIPSDEQLRRYAAQMLMVGFKGNTVDAESDAARYIRDLKVGSIVLFDIDLTGTAKLGSRNITSHQQLAKLTADLQALGDSHWGFVDVTDTWTPAELEPFRKLIKKGKVDMVMTAHIINANIDPEHPATLSRKTIDGVLRKQLGYDGVVVSDDMYMEGIIKKYDIENALVLAINAGCDLLCVGNNINTGFEADRPFRLVDLIVKNVKNGRIPWGRLVQSHRRIEKLLKKLK